MRVAQVTQLLIGLWAGGSLVLASGLALAATQSTTPEPAKAPAVAAPVAPAKEPAAKEPQESKTEQKAEKAPMAKSKAEKEVAADRIVRGEVTAVEAAAKTLTVKTMRNKKEEIVGVEVPDTVKITQGKAVKTLADIKIGDRVWMKYDRMSDKLVADQIRILPHAKMATKAAKNKKTS